MVLFNLDTMMCLTSDVDINDISNDDFYYKLEGENTYYDLLNLMKHYEYIFLKNKRFLFVARIKFAKKYCLKIFNKEYQNLNIYEKIVITYYIFNKSVTQSYFCFQNESNYNIFKKYNLDQLFYLEKNITDCYNNNKKKIWSILKTKIKKTKKIYNNDKTNEHPMMPIGTNDYYIRLKNKKKIFDPYSQKIIEKELITKMNIENEKTKQLLNKLKRKVNDFVIFVNDEEDLIAEKICKNFDNYKNILRDKNNILTDISKLIIGEKLKELEKIFDNEIDCRDDDEKIFDKMSKIIYNK